MLYTNKAVGRHAAIAQSVERILGKDEVASSNLASSSSCIKIALEMMCDFFLGYWIDSVLGLNCISWLHNMCARILQGANAMVIIREHTTESGVLEYTIKDCVSGLVKTWIPPEGIPKEHHEDILKQFADLLDSSHSGCKEMTSKEGSLTPIILRDAGELFLSRKELDLAEYTRYSWSNCLTTRIYPVLGQMHVTDIKPKHIMDLFYNMRQEGLATSTMRKYHMVLTQLFRFLIDYEYVSENIMDRVKKPKPNKEETPTEVEAFTPEQIGYILSCTEGIHLRWRTMMWLMAETGIRRGECVALKWADVDFSNLTITISKNAGYTPEKGVYITTPKNRKPRKIGVDPEVMFLLLRLRRESSSEWVFANRDNPKQCMSPQTPTRYFAKFSKQYDIKLYPHKLRHTFASISILSGADINSVAAILGHHNPAFTLRTYTHANESSQRKASEICREAIRSAMNQAC